MDLSRLVVLARGSIQFELLLHGHGSDDLLSHAACGQVIVPGVAVQQHHDNVEENEECDQVNTILEVGLFGVLHESDDLTDDHWVAHVHEQVNSYAESGENVSVFENFDNGEENILFLLSSECLFNLNKFTLQEIVFSEATQVFHLKSICLGVLDNIEHPAEEQLLVPFSLRDEGWSLPHSFLDFNGRKFG